MKRKIVGYTTKRSIKHGSALTTCTACSVDGRSGNPKKGGDPDRLIQPLIQEKRHASSGKVEEKEFIIHSTSWRYTRPGKVTLT